MDFAARLDTLRRRDAKAWIIVGCLVLALAAFVVLVWLSSVIRPAAIVPSRLRPGAEVWSPDSQDLGALLQIISVLTGLIGIAMLLIPAFVLRPFGMRLDPSGAFGARLFGAASIALANPLLIFHPATAISVLASAVAWIAVWTATLLALVFISRVTLRNAS